MVVAGLGVPLPPANRPITLTLLAVASLLFDLPTHLFLDTLPFPVVWYMLSFQLTLVVVPAVLFVQVFFVFDSLAFDAEFVVALFASDLLAELFTGALPATILWHVLSFRLTLAVVVNFVRMNVTHASKVQTTLSRFSNDLWNFSDCNCPFTLNTTNDKIKQA